MGSTMWVSKPLRFWLAAFAVFWIGTNVAQACLGVSRTINVRSFQAHMGTGGSGGIGLRHKEVVLTFDDGPKRGTTPRILSALRAECTKATFFVVGRMAKANASLLQRVARGGHTIAQHTENHANLRHVSLASAERNIARGVASVRSALGPYRSRSSKLFRYPYLARSNALDGVLRRQGLLPFSAGILSNDWKGGSGAAMVNRVMAQLKRRGRGVILMHDIQSKTASALPLLLRRLKQGGYRVVHVRSGGSGGRSLGPIASSKKATSSRRRASLFSRSTTNRSALRAKRKTVSRATLSKRKSTKRSKRRNAKASEPRTRLGKWLAKRRAASKKKTSTRKVRRRTNTYRAPEQTSETEVIKKRGLSLFGERMRRKEGESAQQYHARLRARRIRLNSETSRYGFDRDR